MKKALALTEMLRGFNFEASYIDHGNGIETVHLKSGVRTDIWDSDPVFRFENDKAVSFNVSERISIETEG